MFQNLLGALGRACAAFRVPDRHQSAALCWRRAAGGGVEVLLVTTRRTGRWTPPKGNPIDGQSGAEVAAQEAWEEAGVRGAVATEPVGCYRLHKFRDDSGIEEVMTVNLYAVAVERLEKDWPERGDRERRWFSPGKAAGLVREPDLARLIRDFRG